VTHRWITCTVIAACFAGAGCRTAGTSVDVGASIGRGVSYLVASQNRDGSWGSATQTKGLNIYAPIPGAHHAFRTATTALCIMALLDTVTINAQAAAALDRAEIFLTGYLPRVRRGELNAIYNVWAHAYGIQALVRLLDRPGINDDERRQRLVQLICDQVEALRRYEFVGGGWGYYEFKRYHFQQPIGDPTSFTTATVLLALHEARRAGVEVPQRLIDRGMTEVRRQRNPNFTYHYSRNWWMRPAGQINRPAGSLGRSQACNAAMRAWGDETVTDAVLGEWLDRLFARQGWLDIGRKRPIPHESWFAVAGYFYYYGHYHAALCIEMLEPQARPRYQHMMARTLIERQESDGSWFDFPFYAYHKPYGTALALMTLQRCRS
jgi:hypothetical protein